MLYSIASYLPFCLELKGKVFPCKCEEQRFLAVEVASNVQLLLSYY